MFSYQNMVSSFLTCVFRGWDYEVLWSGEGVPVHLVNNSWALLGEKTVQRVKIVQDLSYQDRVSHLILSDGVPDCVLLDK